MWGSNSWVRTVPDGTVTHIHLSRDMITVKHGDRVPCSHGVRALECVVLDDFRDARPEDHGDRRGLLMCKCCLVHAFRVQAAPSIYTLC
jgi:hypothetical protein